ncbi:MAG: class I SAM-dependent rRNA methyltransferase, partial [Candidatus Aureabacteria bacterium]|nr:class I SAM-dependent rRNA methyltransferase [Candidatus Auribacterota bacterium]
LARAFYNPNSQIVGRVLSFKPEPLDRAFFSGRIAAALEFRRDVTAGGFSGNARRLINAEGDGLPGLTVDDYAGRLVLRLTSLGMSLRLDLLQDLFVELVKPESIYLRSDPKADEREGITLATGPVYGETPDRVEIEENGVKFLVDVKEGQKTGFYLDQKINRGRVAAYARGKRILDLFCYSGGFGVAALKAGAEKALFMDSSRPALSLVCANLSLNSLPEEKAALTEENIFTALTDPAVADFAPSLIVLDPPAMARSGQDVTRAARGYLFMNSRAFQLLPPGGILATFSCSHYLDDKLFRQVVWQAALDAGKEARIVEELSAAPDHPVSVHHPEGKYLKGLILRVT